MPPSDIRSDAPGIPWDVWFEQQVNRIFAEAREQRKQQAAPVKPISDKVESSGSTTSSRGRDVEPLLDISPYDK